MPNTTLIKVIQTSTGIDFTYTKIYEKIYEKNNEKINEKIPNTANKNTYKKTKSGTYMKLETIREILDCKELCDNCVGHKCFDF